jgi:hypothetical protein
MYQNLKRKGLGEFSDSNYWSSSQDENYDGSAWAQNFVNGEQFAIIKGNSFSVRAVRAF